MTRRDAVAIAILVAVLALVFSDVLFFGRAFYYRDVTRFYYPMKKVTRDIILSGEFPSWNAFLSEGQPLAANPEFAVWYPGNWLLLLPNYPYAFQLHILVHYFLAAIGAYVFLRTRSLRIESALFGAFAYTLGGLLLSLSCLIPYLFCLAWLPWLAYFASATSRRSAALAALCLAMIFLGGEPVTIAQCVMMVAVLVAPRAPKRFALILVAGLLIATVQIVPGADHLRDSVRARPFSFSLVSAWSTPPIKVAELFVSDALGRVSEHARLYWGTAKYGWNDPFFLSIYPGLLVTALVIAALTLRRRGWLIVVIAFCGGLLLAIGSHTPLLKLLYDVRLFSSFRYPEKFLMLAIVPVTFFAAYAFDSFDDALARRALIVASVVFLGCAALSLIALRQYAYRDEFIRFWQIDVHPVARSMADLSRWTWFAGALRALLVIALLAMRRRLGATIWSRVAIAVLVLDLGLNRTSAAETVDREFFDARPQTVPKIAAGTRLFHQADWYGATATARWYFDRPEMFWVLRNGAFPHMNATYGIESALNRDIDQTALLPTTDLLQAMRDVRARTPNWIVPLTTVSAASVRALFVPPAQAGRGETIRPIAFAPLPLHPRFYFADRIVRDNFVSVASSDNWTPGTACVDIAPFPPAHGEVLDVAQTSNSARLRVRSNGEALLVCSITRHKYWHATIDNNPAPLVAANVAYQALRIPPGDHDVQLRYDNPVVRWSGIVSLIALIIVVWNSVATSAKPQTSGGSLSNETFGT